MTLYGKLVEWRDEVAKKEGVMPTMICPLDLLVLMAYKRPGCQIGLKRLMHYIPELDCLSTKINFKPIMFLVFNLESLPLNIN